MNEGKITICGHDLKSDSSNALKNIGVSIEYPSLYPELSGHEHFKIMANWKHLDSKRIEELEHYIFYIVFDFAMAVIMLLFGI